MLCVHIVEADLKMMIRKYSHLKLLNTFEERYDYLKLSNAVGQATFGVDRYINQLFYNSKRWRRTRDGIIIRDNACDLGISEYEISHRVIIHHMNPITLSDIEEDRDELYDPEFLICTTENTHRAIHFGDKSQLITLPIERRKNDTCPWK